MSETRRTLHCTPQEVFDVLADGWTFASWVVGAARIREVDENWPAPGSRIHHSVGVWPLLINDTTSVVEYDAPHSIALQARAWPTGEARVELTCTPEGDGTLVVMTEEPTQGPAQLVPTVLRNVVLHARNSESLKRLGFLASRSHDDQASRQTDA